MAVARQGMGAVYAGISAAWLRQVTYGSGRLGIYSYLLDMDKRRRAASGETGAPSFAAKIGMGVTSGSVGALIGNPAELALVRMGADGKEPDPAKRQAKNTVAHVLAQAWEYRAKVEGMAINDYSEQIRKDSHRLRTP